MAGYLEENVDADRFHCIIINIGLLNYIFKGIMINILSLLHENERPFILK